MMSSNFEYLLKKEGSKVFYQTANYLEQQYAMGDYSSELASTRKIAENIVKHVLNQNYSDNKRTFAENLTTIKAHRMLDKKIVDLLYSIKGPGNQASHELEQHDKKDGETALRHIAKLLYWFAVTYCGYVGDLQPIIEPVLFSTAERHIIYSANVDNSDGELQWYDGLQKVGETTATEGEEDWRPDSKYLRSEARRRIGQYLGTSGLPYFIGWVELAWRKDIKQWFTDHDVHRVLEKSGYEPSKKLREAGAREWYKVDIEHVKKAIAAVKAGRESIDGPVVDTGKIELRPEQKAAVEKTEKTFKTKVKMLWNAKMRFGKTLSALQLIKDEGFAKVLIMTHRPVVADGWFEDFKKIGMPAAGYKYGSRRVNDLSLEALEREADKYVYFASIQDLRGSTAFGGTVADKNNLVKNTKWDLVIIDEAHEGTQTDLAQQVIDGVVTPKYTRLLELSGTPFNLLDKYDEDEVYTWDYVMEQKAKYSWDEEHPDGEDNPYIGLPSVSMYTFEIKKRFTGKNFLDDDKSFNFREFFKVDDTTGEFVYADKVKQFLDNISSRDDRSNYPFSTETFRNSLRHTLWLMPSVKSAKAMERALERHPVFGFYNVINVVDRDTSDNVVMASDSDIQRVKDAITDHPARTKSITLTVRKLTTGVTIKPWTGVIFLSNTNSAMQYLQAAFRAQTPYEDEEFGRKTNCYIFDFAPDRALKVMAAARQMSTGVGKLQTSDQRARLGELLNFLPIIGEAGQGMKAYHVDTLLTQLKKVYAEKAVQSGFDDDSLYNDELLKLTNDDLQMFNDIKAIVGQTSAEREPETIDVNHQGLDDEEYEQAIRAERKAKKERTPEEQEIIDRKNELKMQRRTMISVLRGISIRIPMMIYGMDIDIEQDISVDNFVDRVDSRSWLEFMPKGITKAKFRQISKYYEPQVFLEAGRIIRHRVKVLDQADPLERTMRIAEIFGTFKNPDKETVLTPWRVVNMQLGRTIGGLSYYDDSYQDTTEKGKQIIEWRDTGLTDEIFDDTSHILEINSKTGLYPLYVATSLYYEKLQQLNNTTAGKFTAIDLENLWANVLNQNIFVIAKTEMARTIVLRTLSGYKDTRMNVAFVSDVVSADQKGNITSGLHRIKEAFPAMKFDIVIGNPPYQQQIGNYKYQLHLDFLKLGYELSQRYVCFIQPLNWLNDTKLLDEIRPHLISLHRFSDSTKVFPNVAIPSGVGFALIDKQRTVETTTVIEGRQSQQIKVTGNFNLDDIRLKKLIKFDRSIASRLSDYHGFPNKDKSLSEDSNGDVQIWFKRSSGKSGKNGWMTVSRSAVPAGDIIDEYKVMVPKDGHAEKSDSKPENIFNLKAMVLKPGQISTDRPYLIRADNKKQAELIAKYANSKFFRRILHFQDKASSVPKQAFANVPDISEWIDAFRQQGEPADLDHFLDQFYGLTDQMIQDINSRIARK